MACTYRVSSFESTLVQKGHDLLKQMWGKKLKVSLKMIISPYNSMGRVTLKRHESRRSADR